jgi:hypothetical protein
MQEPGLGDVSAVLPSDVRVHVRQGLHQLREAEQQKQQKHKVAEMRVGPSTSSLKS